MNQPHHRRTPRRHLSLLLTAALAGSAALVATGPTPIVSAAGDVVFDDMEHGDPFGNGWFAFNGNVGGGGISADTDVPPALGGAFSLSSGWGSGGVGSIGARLNAQ